MYRFAPIALLLLPLQRPGQEAASVARPVERRSLASLVPARCAFYLEANGFQPVLAQGLDHPFLHGLLTSELGRALSGELPAPPAALLTRANEWLGGSVLAAAAELTALGLGLGYDPETEKSVLVARSSDAAACAQQVTLLLDAIERQYGSPGALDAPHERWSGAEVWIFGTDAVLARREALVVLANDAELATETLALAADPDGRGLLARAEFAVHQAARPAEKGLWAWLDPSALEARADEGFRQLRAANRSPAMQGLLGARIGALVSAPALSLSARAAGDRGFELRLRASGAAGLAPLAPLARDGAVPAEPETEALASALLYRDYARYFTRRSELFTPDALPYFAEAITNGALFFEGQDLGEDVLAHVSPWIRLVSRELEFADGRVPEIPLPGVALVAVIDDEHAADQWMAAFQTIVAIINVDQAEKGQRSMRLHLAREGEYELSVARFATPAPDDGVDVRYNLEPALAVVGRHLVLGTHESLVRGLVRDLAGAAPSTARDSREMLELDARGLQTVVERNFEVLVAQEMLEEGRGRADAEKEIRGLLLALGALERVRIELGGADPASPELVLRISFAHAEAGR